MAIAIWAVCIGSLAGTALILSCVALGASLVALRRSKVEYRVVQAPTNANDMLAKAFGEVPGIQNLERDIARMNGEAVEDDDQPGEDEESLV